MVDAWAGRDGDSIDSLAPEFFRDWVNSMTTDGAMALPPAAMLGVTDPADVAFVEPRLTPQPRLTFSEPTRLTGAVDQIPCSAVVCVPSRMPFGQWAKEYGWPATEIDSGHEVMVTAPDALTAALLEAP